MIYLDYNATSPLRPEVKDKMLELADAPLNPSSIHMAGRAARKIKEAAREKILESVNAEALVFCGTASEANNIALAQSENNIVSSVEHESVWNAATNRKVIEVDQDGLVDLEPLEQMLKESPKAVVSVILANNETGVINDLYEVAELGHRFGALVHTDAVQAWGKFPLDFKDMGLDMMTISAHKVGGPIGTAALIRKADLELKPVLKGGGQEMNKRPGTEDVQAIVGFATAAGAEMQSAELRDYLEAEIRKIAPDAVIHGQNAPRINNTSNISMPNMEAATQLIHFDSKGICVSAGSACSSGKIEESRVLKAMDVPLSKNAVRASVGWNTTKDEIDRFLRAWGELYQKGDK